MASRSLGIRIARPTRIGGRRETGSWHRPRTRVSDMETLRSSVPTPERREALGRDARGPDGAPMAPDVSTPRLAWAPNPCVWIRLCRRTELCPQLPPPRLIEICFASVAPLPRCVGRGVTRVRQHTHERPTRIGPACWLRDLDAVRRLPPIAPDCKTLRFRCHGMRVSGARPVESFLTPTVSNFTWIMTSVPRPGSIWMTVPSPNEG